MEGLLEYVGCVEADGETIQILTRGRGDAPPTPRHPAVAYDNQLVDVPRPVMNLERRAK